MTLMLTMACAMMLDASNAVCLTSTRCFFFLAIFSTCAVVKGPIRCELCLGTCTLMRFTEPLVGDMAVRGECGHVRQRGDFTRVSRVRTLAPSAILATANFLPLLRSLSYLC